MDTIPLIINDTPKFGLRIQHVQFGGWHTMQYLSPGEAVAILPASFNSETQQVVIVDKEQK